MPLLFSYGTLQQKEVQIANFGRELLGKKDILQGYIVGEIEITDERVLRESGKAIHPILRFTRLLMADVIRNKNQLSLPSEFASFGLYDYE